MLTKITGFIIIFVFTAFSAVLVRAIVRLRIMGMLSVISAYLRSNWLLSILTLLFFLQFFINGFALLIGTSWAVTITRYTIYLWLVYLWLYGLKEILRLLALLYPDQPKSISQFMGHSKFFDEVIKKSIALSKKSFHPEAEVTEEAHAVSDSPWEEMLYDEELFKEILPYAIRKKIRRKIIGLSVQTILFLILLALLE